MKLYPLTFEPIYKDYIWGGERIRALYRPHLPPGVLAESWEIADREEGVSRVTAGPLAGMSLTELMARERVRIAGGAAAAGRFPLIVKVLDVAQRTSLQVHPRHRAQGNEPKNEMWVALEGMAPSRLLAGLRPGVTRQDFEEALREQRIESVVRAYPVRAGEAFDLPGGRVHAADAGCLLFEVQQNSNTTYRVFDWDRRDAGGDLRPLHLDQALAAIDWQDRDTALLQPRRLSQGGGVERELVLQSPHFRVERVRIETPWSLLPDPRSFRLLFALSGEVVARGGEGEARLAACTTCLLPAALEGCEIVPLHGRPAEFLLTTL